MATINLLEQLEELKEQMSLISRDFTYDYSVESTQCIYDAITEYADSHVDIYYCDLAAWFGHHWELVDESNDELGRPDTIMEEIQQAQFLYNDRQINEDIINIIKILSIRYLVEDLKIIEVNKLWFDYLACELEYFDLNNDFNDIKICVDECIKEIGE